MAASAKSEISAGCTVRPTVVVWVALAAVPVTVIVYVPGAVAEPTPTVIVEDTPALTNAGAKLTDVAAGWPAALNTTAWGAPEVIAVVIDDVPLEPCTNVSDGGVNEIENSDALTVNATVVERVMLIPVPVTVIAYVPGAVAGPTETVIVDDPPDMTEDGLNDTEVPAG